MDLPRKFLRLAANVVGGVYARLPVQGVTRPVLIIGCGRSGTTVLGNILSRHPAISFLNEPRHIWCACYPAADIWSWKASSRAGRLLLTKDDADPLKSRRLARLLRFESVKTGGGNILLEKLPANVFRLDFIDSVFPDARYIHICRSGLETARSIAEISRYGSWWGVRSYKWKELVRIASLREETAGLPDLCRNFYHRGLLEWRLSTEFICRFLNKKPIESFRETSYDSLVDHSVETIVSLLKFLGLEMNSEVDEFIGRGIHRFSPKLRGVSLSDTEVAIGGELLRVSVESEPTAAILRRKGRAGKNE